MRYRFIQAEKAVYPVGMLCRVLDVARSGFYAWCHRPMSRRARENYGLMTHIRACYQASRGRYGESADSSGSSGARVPGGPSSSRETDAAP